jgi:hypothetical protein
VAVQLQPAPDDRSFATMFANHTRIDATRDDLNSTMELLTRPLLDRGATELYSRIEMIARTTVSRVKVVQPPLRSRSLSRQAILSLWLTSSARQQDESAFACQIFIDGSKFPPEYAVNRNSHGGGFSIHSAATTNHEIRVPDYIQSIFGSAHGVGRN